MPPAQYVSDLMRANIFVPQPQRFFLFFLCYTASQIQQSLHSPQKNLHVQLPFYAIFNDKTSAVLACIIDNVIPGIVYNAKNDIIYIPDVSATEIANGQSINKICGCRPMGSMNPIISRM